MIIGVFFKMMLKVFFNHILCQLTRGYAKVAASPKVFTPIPLFQMWKFFKYFPGHPPFYSTHYIRGRNVWRCRNQDMDMIFADNAAHDVDFKPITGLTDKLSDAQGHIPLQYVISIFGYPNEVVLDLKFCMTVLPIAHAKHYKTTTGKMLPA